jgi:hypothetical protein
VAAVTHTANIKKKRLRVRFRLEVCTSVHPYVQRIRRKAIQEKNTVQRDVEIKYSAHIRLFVFVSKLTA